MRLARSAVLLLALAALAAAPAAAASTPIVRDSVAPTAVAADTVSSMPTTIVLYASYELAVSLRGEPLPLGAMYPSDHYNDARIANRSLLTSDYRSARAQLREPLFVVLPDGCNFCVDSVTMKDGVPGLAGWSVAGEAPRLTLTPSVDIKGGWHGYIRDGEISDDVSGRSFDYPKRQ